MEVEERHLAQWNPSFLTFVKMSQLAWTRTETREVVRVMGTRISGLRCVRMSSKPFVLWSAHSISHDFKVKVCPE